MSSSETNIHESLARKLGEAGFKKTSLGQAVWELVQSYLVGHKNPGENITNALKSANAKVTEVVPPVPTPGLPITSVPAANDSHIHEKKTGTNG